MIEQYFPPRHEHTAESVLAYIREHGPTAFRTLAPSRKSTTKVRLTARAAVTELEKQGLVRLTYIGRSPFYVTQDWFDNPDNKVLHIQGLTRMSICGCHIWTGYMDPLRGPMVRFGQSAARGVRRVLLEKQTGKRLATREVVKVTCEEERCVNPEHFNVIVINTDRKGIGKTMATRMKLSEAMRKFRGKLTVEQIEEIRASDEHDVVLAERMNVSRSNIWLIRQHRIHKDLGNPFAGMFTTLVAANDGGRKRA